MTEYISIAIISLTFLWLMFETKWLTIRLPIYQKQIDLTNVVQMVKEMIALVEAFTNLDLEEETKNEKSTK